MQTGLRRTLRRMRLDRTLEFVGGEACMRQKRSEGVYLQTDETVVDTSCISSATHHVVIGQCVFYPKPYTPRIVSIKPELFAAPPSWRRARRSQSCLRLRPICLE